MTILWPTSKLKNKHLKGPAAGFSLCGMGRVGMLKFAASVDKTNCGNCLAILRTTIPPSSVTPVTEERKLFVDFGRLGPSTVWEHDEVHNRMWPLNIQGSRLPIEHCDVPTIDQVMVSYGPLTEITEVELLWRYMRYLEDRQEAL